MTGFDVFAASLQGVVRDAPNLHAVLAERFGSPAHERMLEAHEVNRERFRVHQRRWEERAARERLRVAVEESVGWADRGYRFTDEQLTVALAAGKAAA